MSERIIIGLTGATGTGKDTVADHLVKQHGFKKLAFADTLRVEVVEAWGISVGLLDCRATKETPTQTLALAYCRDQTFLHWLRDTPDYLNMRTQNFSATVIEQLPRSPRWAMERWGDYRRSIDPHYFCDRIEDQVDLHPNRRLVISDVRTNPAPLMCIEPLLIYRLAGRIWSIERTSHVSASNHVTNRPLPNNLIDLRIANSGTIDSLLQLVDLHIAGILERNGVTA